MKKNKMKFVLIALFSGIGFLLQGQTIADFENFDLTPDTFLNGSDLNGGFISDPIFLPNSYNPEFSSWTDWSISNVSNDSIPGFGNQYAAFAGEGANETNTYAVASAFSPVRLYAWEDGGLDLDEIYVTNSTYAALSMQNGDSFSKIFGGETGDDPDYFLLTIKAFYQDVVFDSIVFYLADYRFEDNSQDYIVKEWTKIDLSSFAYVDSIEFSLNSSDVGMFGMNTPAYFCIDQVQGDFAIVSVEDEIASELTIYPNPVVDHLFINNSSDGYYEYQIFSALGNLVNIGKVSKGFIDVSELIMGNYFLKINNGKSAPVLKFVKL